MLLLHRCVYCTVYRHAPNSAAAAEYQHSRTVSFRRSRRGSYNKIMPGQTELNRYGQFQYHLMQIEFSDVVAKPEPDISTDVRPYGISPPPKLGILFLSSHTTYSPFLVSSASQGCGLDEFRCSFTLFLTAKIIAVLCVEPARSFALSPWPE